jgi:galactokinase
VRGIRGGGRVVLSSAERPELCDLALPVSDALHVRPSWARYVAGVCESMGASVGFDGSLSSTVPPGAGLSSSAALENAVALAIGFAGSPVELAQMARRAEHLATGTPTGIMDQLVSAAGVDGHALMIDCHSLTWDAVPVPDDLQVVVVHSGQERALANSAYGERVAQCEAAEAVIGPLRLAAIGSVDAIEDPLVRARARHVIGENDRVRAAGEALRGGDHAVLGELMTASHWSLAHDYGVSTSVLDELVTDLCAIDGVFGARLTGAGFGGCLVVACRPGTLDGHPVIASKQSWVVRPVAGAALV